MAIFRRGTAVFGTGGAVFRPSSQTAYYLPEPIIVGIDMEIVDAELDILSTINEHIRRRNRNPGDDMIRLSKKVRKGASCFPYIIPTDRDGDPLTVAVIQSVTWSIFDTDGTAVETEDVAITSADSEGRWVANVTPDYTDYTGDNPKKRIIVFTITFAATIGGVNYTDLVAKIQGIFTINPITGE